MPPVSRRTLLASTAALIAARGLPARASPAKFPPVAPVRPVTETLYGVKITDPYRWMESEDAEWQRYVRAQGAYTAAILDKIPGRAALADTIAHNTGAIVAVVSLQTGGGRLFTEIRHAGANVSKLFVRDSLTGPDRKLVDPDQFAAPGSHDALDWWAASPDGGHVAIGVSGGGSEQSVLHIVNTATGAL
ncbi:MAG: hypothetical protein POH28_03940, partial [Acidocella sp.]|nr:hypothetical protein [Acidocella sp.]